jgi:peroxiredoxin
MLSEVGPRPFSSTPAEHLAAGDRAPELTVLDSSGSEVRLADLWASGPIVLTFLRHFG